MAEKNDKKRPLFTLSQGEDARGRTAERDVDAEESLGLRGRGDRPSREERVDRMGREAPPEKMERNARQERSGRAEREFLSPRAADAAGPQPVAIVDVDIPFSSIAYLFIKFLIVLVPFIAVLGLMMRFVWKLAAG